MLTRCRIEHIRRSHMNSQKLIAKKFINEHPLGVLSIGRDKNAPYAASMFILTDDKLNLFFITKSDTEKYRILKKNRNVAITITDFEAQQTIQAEGAASELTAEGGVMEETFKKLSGIKPHGKTNWLPPIVKLQAGVYVIFEIKVTKMRYGDFKDAISSSGEDVFVDII